MRNGVVMTRFTREDASRLGDVLTQVGRSEILPRFFGRDFGQVSSKTSTFDIVTAADESAETAISSALLKCYPHAVIIGEEGVGRTPGLLDRIETAELAFLVDPLDGTKNFAGGIPLFGMMIAATCRGEVVFSAIHDPVCRETYFAIRDEGAWRRCEKGEEYPLRVAPAVPVSAMHCVVGTNFLPPALRATVSANLSRVQLNFWMRCAATEYRMAATGECHALCYNRLMPWDHAAGWLLHREAGGYSAHFNGTPYRPSSLTGGLLCAPDQGSWRALNQALFHS